MRRLLVATDLSSRSDRAIRRAADLAQAFGAELRLLHVVDDDKPARLVEAERREALAQLRQMATSLPELSALAPSILVETGDAFDGIIRAAEAHAADLVVLGEHRRRPLHDIVLGTTVARVIRHGRHPVLMVHQPSTGPYRRILAATDLLEHAAFAVRTAARLGLLTGTELTLIHAFEPPGMDAIARAGLSKAEVNTYVEDATREARTELDRFTAGLALDTPPVRLTENGRAATILKAAVERLRPDLLVIGTANAGLLRRTLLGSVAAEVLAEIHCDALIVPPDRAG
jgi:nucleotide-binding universal stress UspA family protein